MHHESWLTPSLWPGVGGASRLTIRRVMAREIRSHILAVLISWFYSSTFSPLLLHQEFSHARVPRTSLVFYCNFVVFLMLIFHPGWWKLTTTSINPAAARENQVHWHQVSSLFLRLINVLLILQSPHCWQQHNYHILSNQPQTDLCKTKLWFRCN